MTLYSDLNYIKPSLGGDYLLEDVDSVFQSLFSCLGTKRGQRVFRPNFGADLNRYLFEPCDELTARSIFYDVQNIVNQEPRVQFNTTKSSVTPIPNEQMFVINAVYTILGFDGYEKSLTLTLKQRDRQ